MPDDINLATTIVINIVENKIPNVSYEEKNIRHWDLYLILNTKIKENRLDDKSDNSWLIDNSDLD